MAKKALCVGINDYPGTSSDLKGCVNDANDWEAELKRRGYSVTKLLDAQANRAGMVAALTALIQGARDGDTLVFTYSGHGSWLPDENHDEGDGRDEMLCPHDVASGQYLLDDDIYDIFVRKPAGATLFMISDSCHSGTVARLAPPIGGAQNMPIPRLLPPLEFVKDPATRALIEQVAQAAPSASSTQKYPALLLSGCRDFELSYDAFFNGRPNGALTRAALDALRTNPGTPAAWWKEIRKNLPSNYCPQTPQLFGSRAAKAGPLFLRKAGNS
jgi:hypothetical protein